MCKLCDEGKKAVNVIYLNHTTADSTKVIIPICVERIEAFKQDVFKLRKKYCGPTLSKASKKTRPPSFCMTCSRDTKAPLFSGCMTPNCPRGYKPCF